jgi:hypothetical protein
LALPPGAMRVGVHNILQGVFLRFVFLLQDVGKSLGKAGSRFENGVEPRQTLGFKVSTWQDNKIARHIVSDTSDPKALCGLPHGPWGWENINQVYQRDLWPIGICPACFRRFSGTKGDAQKKARSNPCHPP